MAELENNEKPRYRMMAIDVTEDEHVRFKLECIRRRLRVGKEVGRLVREQLGTWEGEGKDSGGKKKKVPVKV